MARLGKIIVNTRPNNVEIYLDGQPVLDTLGQIAKTPTMILNVQEGMHSVTFSKDGYDSTTLTVNVKDGSDSDVKAILNTSQIRYPMMLSAQPTQPVGIQPLNNNDVCSKLKAAIEDEFNAIVEYSKLLEEIDDQYKEVIKDIIEDETEHYIELKKLAEQIQCPSISSTQPSPGWPALPIPQIPYGHIVANTIPDDAEVYLDGQPVFDTVGRVVTTPVTILDIVTGIHRVTFRKQGYFDENIDISIQNGLYSDASAVLRLRMAPMSSSPNIEKLYAEPDYMQFHSCYQNYLQPRQRGTVHFDTSPHGAIIMVDGQYLTDPDTEEYIRTPASVLLFEGRRDFVLKLENHHDASGYVDVFAGSRVDVFRNMEPIPGSNIRSAYSLPYPYYPGYGDISIDSNPQGGYIYIDGYPLMNESGNAVLTPVKATGIMEGMHEIRIAKDGYYEKQLIVNIISGQDNRAHANLQPIYG